MVYKPEHPHSRQNGYIAEHILVALEAAGLDKMPDNHCTHHVDLKKDNNTKENLVICDHKTHQFFHTQLEALAVKLLLETGKIEFKIGVGYVEV